MERRTKVPEDPRLDFWNCEVYQGSVEFKNWYRVHNYGRNERRRRTPSVDAGETETKD